MAEEAGPTNKIVVVVEDDPFIGELVRETISAEPGYQASLVNDASQALALLKQVKAQLLIIDINLPGMDGYALHDAVRSSEDFGSPTVLFMSAGMHENEAKKRGVANFLAKPFDLDELLAKVNQLTQGYGTQPSI